MAKQHIIPALSGLKGDGVLPEQIDIIKATYTPQIQQLQVDCKAVHGETLDDQKNKREVPGLIAARTKSLVDSARNILDAILRGAGHPR